MTKIIGHKGGGKGGSGAAARAPIEAPDSLRSYSFARLIDLISEGEIEGMADSANPLKSIYLDGTPIQNADGSYNFTGVTLATRNGTQAQGYVPGFPSVESEVAVGVQVTNGSPVVRAINTAYDAVRVTLSIPQLSSVNTTNGDTNGTSVQIAIDVQASGGSYVEKVNDTITGKTTTKYQKSYNIQLTGSPPWNIRLRRITADSGTATLQNQTWFESYTQILNSKLRYPNSALAALVINSQQFSRIPVRGYDIKGKRIKVPSNATVNDDGSLSYSGSWDGTFIIRWTNNPAWVFYDMLVNTRYGLGNYITEDQIDKWALYQIGRYCDELVDDGFGGTEPRFSCNLYLQEQAAAFKVMQDLASVFRGMIYWAGGQLAAIQDSPADAVALFTDANVISRDDAGEPVPAFTYQGSSLKTRHSVALVSWNDPDDFYKLKPEYVEDPDAIARYGIVPTNIVAIGCTSRGQAHRVGKWLLYSEANETETVTFKVGLDGALVRPGNVIQVADRNRAGARRGGRVMASSAVVRNEIKNSGATGAVVGTIGSGGSMPTSWFVGAAVGLTWSIVGSGTDDSGIGYVDIRFAGTTTGTTLTIGTDAVAGITAALGQQWRASGYIGFVGGSWSNVNGARVRVEERSSTGSFLTSSSSPDAQPATADMVRYNVSRTFSNASVARALMGFVLTFPSSGVGVDITLRLGGAMLEQSATLGQYVGTSGAARSAVPSLTVDQAFTPSTGVEYTLSVLLPDGSIGSCPIDSIAGNVITLKTAKSGTISAQPVDNAIWLVSSSELAPQTFRVLTAVDADDGIEVTALKHIPAKFAAVESGVILTANPISVLNTPPDAPAALTISESLYLQGGQVRVLVTVSWNASDRATSYDLVWKRSDGVEQAIGGLLSPICEIRDALPGVYKISVVARSINNKVSSPSSATKEIFGKLTPPGDVKNFTIANVANGVAVLTWAQAEDLDVQFGGYIRIRHTPDISSPDWSNAVDISPALPGNSTSFSVPHLPGTYLARFIDSSGQQSMNAAAAQATASALIQMNVISTLTQNPGWAGTKNNAVYDSGLGGLKIDSLSTLVAPPIDQWEYLNAFEVTAAGTYDFASGDLGAVYTSRLMAQISVQGLSGGNNIDDWVDIDGLSSIDGAVVDDVNAILLVRTTNDNPSGSPTWSPWAPFLTGQYSARAFQFRLALVSGSPVNNVLVTALSVTVDMPDRVESALGVASGAGALAVTFASAFQTTPAIAITPRNIGTGEYYQVTGQSRTGFTVTFYNAAGTAINRNFDWMAKGYGVAS